MPETRNSPVELSFINPLCRIGMGAAGAILIITSIGDIGAQSKGAYSWEDETSFAALQLRAIGFQKLALGIAIGTLATAGIKEEDIPG